MITYRLAGNGTDGIDRCGQSTRACMPLGPGFLGVIFCTNGFVVFPYAPMPSACMLCHIFVLPFVMAKTDSKLPTDEHFPHPLDGLRAPHLKLHTPHCIHRYGETTRDIIGEVRLDEMGERPRHLICPCPHLCRTYLVLQN